MTHALEVNQLIKCYGSKKALQGITFSVQRGSCFGLLGPNGAGKSTTMKIVTGVLDADGGETTLLGQSLKQRKREILSKIGYVPQSITLYEKLSAYQNLVFFGEMHGVRGNKLKQRIAEVLEQVGLTEQKNQPVATFSGGMKRRINIASAMLHQPELFILDEPTVGIDPQSRNHIFGMIREMKRQGATVIYSTHYMEEVEALCDEVAIIDHGQVIAQGRLDQLIDQYTQRKVYLEADGTLETPNCQDAAKVIQSGKGWLIETETPVKVVRQLSEWCMDRRAAVKKLEIVRPSLEAVFLALTGTSLRD